MEQQYYKNTTDMVRFSVYLVYFGSPTCLAGWTSPNRQVAGSAQVHPKDVAETLQRLGTGEKN
jgi:hypothetical protein